jgi:hypothetical protein
MRIRHLRVEVAEPGEIGLVVLQRVDIALRRFLDERLVQILPPGEVMR